MRTRHEERLSRRRGSLFWLLAGSIGVSSLACGPPGVGELDQFEVADVGHVFDVDISMIFSADMRSQLGERALLVLSDLALDCEADGEPIPSEARSVVILVARTRHHRIDQPYDLDDPDEPRLLPGRYENRWEPGLGGTIGLPDDYFVMAGAYGGPDASVWCERIVTLTRVDRYSERLVGVLSEPDDTEVGRFDSRPCPALDRYFHAD